MAKRILIAAALLLALFLLVRSFPFFTGGTAIAPPTTENTSGAPDVVVESVVGSVDREGPAQSWTALVPGDKLALDTVVRTGPDGTVGLSMGKDTRVTVSPESRLSVLEITREVARVQVKGRVSAAIEGNARLQLAAEGSDAVADAGKGEFSLLTDGEGNVAVSSQRGKVLVSAREQTVEVNAGEQSMVRRELPPTAPKPIPASLFLKLGKPEHVAQRERETVVRGRTSAGAMVSINGVRVAASETGEFSAPIPLKEGPNRIVVEVKDSLGRKERNELPEITVDSTVGKITSGVTWE